MLLSIGPALTPLKADKFAELVASQPGFSHADVQSNTLTLLNDNVSDEEEVTIDVIVDALDPAIDSSSMTPTDWTRIAQRIAEHYSGCNGIVVLHGTDTMAFSSSAISYWLGDGVSKPIIFTGSQVPLSKTRNDAERNLITSLTIAATQPDLNEVALYFDNKLVRGNRAVKISASAFHAFESPNHPPLGRVGIEIKLEKPMLLKPPAAKVSLDHELNLIKLKDSLKHLHGVYKNFSVVTIMLYPGIVTSTITSMIEGTKPPVKGIIIQAFGAGNAPANNDMIQTLKDAHDNHGIVLCDITQIVSGGVDLDAYASAAGLKHAGAISGYDLTPEAALTKMIHLIGQGYSQQEVETMMMTPFQGDLTHAVKSESDSYWDKLVKKHGLPDRVKRLMKKRKA